MIKSRCTFPLLLFVLLFSTACTGQVARVDKPHHTENGFTNPQEKEEHSFWDLVKWRWDRLFKHVPDADDYDFPLLKPDLDFLRSNSRQNNVTWIGHATLLVQMSGVNVLTDPQFSQRASPLQWIGPERAVPPAITLAELPHIDYVIISHDHYDSLDVDSVLGLYNRPDGDKTKFIVPLALKQWFADLGIDNVVELDWWESWSDKDVLFTAVPTQHWSKRTPFSRNTTLWAGWVVKSKDVNFYFCGDSGYYQPMFREVGEKLGPFDLAAIPVGAYEPRWFMKDKHVNPEEAVKVHIDLQARQSLGIHWGTFVLTDEPLDEPPGKLAEAKVKYQLDENDFVLLKHGGTMKIGANQKVTGNE